VKLVPDVAGDGSGGLNAMLARMIAAGAVNEPPKL
jgi:hypothetical protein